MYINFKNANSKLPKKEEKIEPKTSITRHLAKSRISRLKIRFHEYVFGLFSLHFILKCLCLIHYEKKFTKLMSFGMN